MILIFDADHNVAGPVREALEAAGVQIDSWVDDGPAGGNPRVTVTADSRDAVEFVVDLYFGSKRAD